MAGRVLVGIFSKLFTRAAPAVVQAEVAVVRTAATAGARVGAEAAEIGAASAARTATATGARVGATETAEALAARMAALEAKVASDAASALGRNGWTDRRILLSKLLYGSVGVAVVDSATGGHVRRNVFAPALSGTLNAISYIPFVGKDMAVSLASVIGSTFSYLSDTGVDALAQNAEGRGHDDVSLGVRTGNVILNKLPSILSIVVLADESKKTSTFISQVESAGIRREEMVAFFSEYPDQVNEAKRHGVNLHEALPGLDEAIRLKAAERAATAGTPSAQAPAAGAAALTGTFMTAADVLAQRALDKQIAETKWLYIGPGLTAAYNRVCALTKDPESGIKLGEAFDWARMVADWNIPIISTIARSLAVGIAAPDVRDRYKNFTRDAANGDLVGNDGGVLGLNGAGITRFKPTSNGSVFDGPQMSPA